MGPRHCHARLPVLALAVLLAVIALPALVSAHAVLVSSSPADGAHLTVTPDHVEVVLSEHVDARATTLEVYLADGTRVDQGDMMIGGGSSPTLTVHLKPGLADGVYEARWSTVSADDGHPTSGPVDFAVGAFEPNHAAAPNPDRIDWAQAGSRWLLFGGFSLAFGAGALRLATAAWPARRLHNGMALGAALHALGVGGLMAATSRNYPSTGAFLASQVGSELYIRLLVGLGAFAILAVDFVRPRPNRFAIPVAGALMAVAAFQTSGLAHASVAGLGAVSLDTLHLVAATTWLGALILLTRLLLAKDGPAPDVVQTVGIRFGTLAMMSLLVLTATGVLTAIVIAGPELRHDFFGSLSHGWGLFLLGKVVLAGLMVGLAGVNRYVFLAPASTAGLAGAMQRAAARATAGRAAPMATGGRVPELGKWVRREALIGVIVLVLAGILTSVSPPTTAAPSDPGLQGAGRYTLVVLRFEPHPAAGATSAIRIHVSDLQGNGLTDDPACTDHCLVLTFTQSNSTDRQVRTARSLGAGDWEADPIIFPAAGPRQVAVTIQSAEFYQDVVTFAFTVAG